MDGTKSPKELKNMKKAYYDANSLGFRTRPQMRYLLNLYKRDPSRYAWVARVLKEHGATSEEAALKTYWDEPYRESPDTPSYKYTGRKAMLEKLIKIAQKFDDFGNSEAAKKLDTVVIRKMMVDEDAAQSVANAFWSVRKNEVPSNPEKLVIFINETLSEFRPFQRLPNEETREEARRMVADKILGRG